MNKVEEVISTLLSTENLGNHYKACKLMVLLEMEKDLKTFINSSENSNKQLLKSISKIIQKM